MRVAVTGSSGLIGQAVLRALEARGHEAVPLVRRPARPGEVQWGPDGGQLDPAALGRVDAAINLAGENIAQRWTRSAREEIRSSRLSATSLLARTLAQLRPLPSVLVSVSAVGFYGDRGDDLLTEDSPPGVGFLTRVVQEWEAAAKPAAEAGIRVVHPRFGIVLSRDGGALQRMLPFFKLGLGGRIGNGSQWMSWIALEDLVAALLFLLESSELKGPVNVATPNPVRNALFTKALGRVLSRPTLFPVPPAALYLLYGQDMPKETLLPSARVSPRCLLQAGFGFRFPDLEPALHHILKTRS